MVTNIILLVCVYPFVLFMYVLLKNMLTPKKGLWYGVSLKKSRQIHRRWRKLQKPITDR